MSGIPIQLGFWRNWNGPSQSFLDTTLTLPKAQGALLTSFLAIFTSVAVANLWPIICLALHQWRSTPSPRLGLYHQQQAILSNTPSPAASAVLFAKLAWAWRSAKVRGTLASSVVLVVVAVVTLLLSAAAGLATARVQIHNNEVLIAAGNCGWVGFDFLPINEEQPTTKGEDEATQVNNRIVTSAWAHWVASRGLEYVRNCYMSSNISVKSDGCNTFTAESLLPTTREVDCPFSDEICGQPRAFEVDTGFIDSNRDLGINSDEDESLRFRKVTTCVPMPQGRFSTEWVSERRQHRGDGASLPGDKYKYFEVGSSLDHNYTWAVSNYSFVGAEIEKEKEIYSLRAVTSWADSREDGFISTFEPIPPLLKDDADTTVLGIVNNARYASPVEDPWFRATNRTDPTGANRPITISPVSYVSDEIFSSLACTEQYQFCTADTCSPLAGMGHNITLPWRGLDLNEAQKAVFNMITTASLSVTMASGIIWLGSGILRANEFLWFADGVSFSTGLPPTHWQDEVTNFVHLMTAVMQRLVVDYASPSRFIVQTSSGPVRSTDYIFPPRDANEQGLCSRIRVRDADYTNFSAVGLVIILVFGVVVISTNMFMMPWSAFWLRRKLHREPYPEKEWHAGELLMQQREALASKGIGPWELDKATGIPWVKPASFAVDGNGPLRENPQTTTKGLESHEKPV